MWHEPRFWHAGHPGPWPTALAPVAAVYGTAVRLRHLLTTPERAGVPVVCVGNPGLGGGGKTPTAIALVKRLAAAGERPHLLTRGYGGRLEGPVTVDPARHSAAEVGDEPLLAAAAAPVHVAADRRAGARLAVAAGASVIVMDDGYQNPTLAKDLSLLVVDGEAGLGNGRVFPAGPLREPLAMQLGRAGATIVVGTGAAGDRFASIASARGVAVLRARLVASDDAPDLAGREVVAFCGIARPAKFTASLAAAGANVVRAIAFPDHHPFSATDVAKILKAAEARPGALLVTTAKDRVRIGPDNDPGGRLAARALVLPVEMRFEDAPALDSLLASALAAAGRPR